MRLILQNYKRTRRSPRLNRYNYGGITIPSLAARSRLYEEEEDEREDEGNGDGWRRWKGRRLYFVIPPVRVSRFRWPLPAEQVHPGDLCYDAGLHPNFHYPRRRRFNDDLAIRVQLRARADATDDVFTLLSGCFNAMRRGPQFSYPSVG